MLSFFRRLFIKLEEKFCNKFNHIFFFIYLIDKQTNQGDCESCNNNRVLDETDYTNIRYNLSSMLVGFYLDRLYKYKL